jgi:hypothetical protein
MSSYIPGSAYQKGFDARMLGGNKASIVVVISFLFFVPFEVVLVV